METSLLEVQRLSERLARHEQALRRWTRIVLIVLLLVGSGLVIHQAQSGQSVNVVEANKVVIRDTSGMVRGELSTDGDGAPKLWLYDQRGSRRAEFSLLSDGTPGVRLLDQQERILVDVGLPEGQPSVSLRDTDGKDRAKLVVLRDGEPFLQLRDKRGNAIWSAPQHRLETKD